MSKVIEMPPVPETPKKEPETKEEIINALKKKEFYGTIDRLERGKITLEQAKKELLGIRRPEVIVQGQPKNPYEFAAELKSQGVGRQESWSRWVQHTKLKPGMDAKDWYKIYDSL